MKNTLKLSILLLVLTVAACSKYNAESNGIAVIKQNAADSVTFISNKHQVPADSSKIVFENNIYRSDVTIEG